MTQRDVLQCMDYQMILEIENVLVIIIYRIETKYFYFHSKDNDCYFVFITYPIIIHHCY